MELETDILSELEVIGFTTYEAKVIYVLFENRIVTPTEVSKQAGISRAYAYDVLKSFVEKGICNEIQTSSIVKYEMIDPEVVKDKFENEILSTYKIRTKKLNSSFEKLIPKYRSKETKQEFNDVELIKGFNKHRFEKSAELMRNVKKEMLLINKIGGYMQSEVDETSKQLIQRGVALKSIYEVSSNFKINSGGKWIPASNKELISIFNRFEKMGEQIRLSAEVFQNLIIFDREIVFVSLADPKIPKYNRSDVIIKDEYYANSMAQYFDYFWNQCKTVNEFSKELISKN